MKKSIGPRMKFTLFCLIRQREKYNKQKQLIRKISDPVWGLNLGVHAYKKNSSHFEIGGVYMLHRGTCAL